MRYDWGHTTTTKKRKTGNFEQGTSSKNKQYNLYSRTATKLKPEHGICRQNGPNVAKYRIGVRMKNFSSECLGVSYYQRSDDSLPLVAFWRDNVNLVFLKYSKEGRSSPSHVRIRSVPSNVCYDDTKHY